MRLPYSWNGGEYHTPDRSRFLYFSLSFTLMENSQPQYC